jgi:hypothetical protein
MSRKPVREVEMVGFSGKHKLAQEVHDQPVTTLPPATEIADDPFEYDDEDGNFATPKHDRNVTDAVIAPAVA